MTRALALVLSVLALAGCARQIDGTARPEGAVSANPDLPADVLQECQLVSPEQMAAAVGADTLDQRFFGAICRWNADGPSGPVKITFTWFENGALEVERETNTRLGYTVTDDEVSGVKILRLEQPDDPASCGTAAPAASQGVIGWWVHYRPDSTGDACAAARTLTELSVNRAV